MGNGFYKECIFLSTSICLFSLYGCADGCGDQSEPNHNVLLDTLSGCTLRTLKDYFNFNLKKIKCHFKSGGLAIGKLVEHLHSQCMSVSMSV